MFVVKVLLLSLEVLCCGDTSTAKLMKRNAHTLIVACQQLLSPVHVAAGSSRSLSGLQQHVVAGQAQCIWLAANAPG